MKLQPFPCASFSSFLVFSQALTNTFSAPLPELLVLPLPLLPQQPRSLHIRRALIVGAMEQADRAEKNGFRGLNRAPPLSGGFVTIFIVLGRM